MNTFKPVKKKDIQCFKSLSKINRFDTTDVDFIRSMPRRYPKLFDKHSGMLDIYKSNRRKTYTIMPIEPEIKIIPIREPTSRLNEKRRNKFGIYRL